MTSKDGNISIGKSTLMKDISIKSSSKNTKKRNASNNNLKVETINVRKRERTNSFINKLKDMVKVPEGWVLSLIAKF